LRADTKDAYDEAKALEVRWKEVEREQREVYQVRAFCIYFPNILRGETHNSVLPRNFC